ncbi:MAG: hypothetical protein V4649_06845 [Bacteroidota bacterium]
MKRIAGNIWSTISNTFSKGANKVVATEEYERGFYSNPRESNGNPEFNYREDYSMSARAGETSRAYASNDRNPEIQYC